MTYYRQEFGMGRYPNPMARQRFVPPPMYGQRIGYPRSNEFPRQRDSFYSPVNQIDPRQGQQQFNPYSQGNNSRYGGLSDNINTMAGHMGTITNGINMMKQVGAIISLFR